MESQPQNPEFRINPENFYPCSYSVHKLLTLEHFWMAEGHSEYIIAVPSPLSPLFIFRRWGATCILLNGLIDN